MIRDYYFFMNNKLVHKEQQFSFYLCNSDFEWDYAYRSDFISPNNEYWLNLTTIRINEKFIPQDTVKRLKLELILNN